ncbi:zinc finger protein 765-like [Uranotaenia lowii]|uniref:zinc finger protein 765-like n=1 Tax=Uranotaenia lowii TaxID=190385 RepID=UPI0024798791|nr:zinc finger protein 765-like [Uranotaenia lowii]
MKEDELELIPNEIPISVKEEPQEEGCSFNLNQIYVCMKKEPPTNFQTGEHLQLYGSNFIKEEDAWKQNLFKSDSDSDEEVLVRLEQRSSPTNQVEEIAIKNEPIEEHEGFESESPDLNDSITIKEEDTWKEKLNASGGSDIESSSSGTRIRYRPKCTECSKTFSCNLRLNYHYALKHTVNSEEVDQEAECVICNQKLQSKAKLIWHMTYYHGKKETFSCDQCKAIFREPFKLEDHYAAAHLGKPRYECEFCKKQFFHRSAYQVHRKHKHPKEHSELVKNGRKAPLNIINVLDDAASKPSKFQCKICNEKFDNRFVFEDHKSSHPKKLKHACNKCDKTFGHKDSLEYHFAKEHIGKPRYGCDFCDKQFYHSSDYYKHRKSRHSEEYAALRKKHNTTRNLPIKELYSLSELMGLESAVKRKPNEESTRKSQYQCEFCGAQFFCLSVYYKHRKLNHSDRVPVVHKPYKCETCEKAYSSQSTLDNHVALAHERKTTDVCEYCGQRFFLRARYVNHVRTKHPEEKLQLHRRYPPKKQ